MTGVREPKPRRTPHIVAAGFVLAFAASVFTLIYTGLMVGPPRRDHPPQAETTRQSTEAPSRPERGLGDAAATGESDALGAGGSSRDRTGARSREDGEENALEPRGAAEPAPPDP